MIKVIRSDGYPYTLVKGHRVFKKTFPELELYVYLETWKGKIVYYLVYEGFGVYTSQFGDFRPFIEMSKDIVRSNYKRLINDKEKLIKNGLKKRLNMRINDKVKIK